MIDHLDMQILKMLCRDGRLSYREIAKRLNVAVGTVQARIKRMEKNGVIKGYGAHVDYGKIGYGVYALIGLKIRYPEWDNVTKVLARIPNVVRIYDITGEHDVMLVVRFEDLGQLDAFLRQLRHPGIEHTTTYIILKTVKETNLLEEM